MTSRSARRLAAIAIALVSSASTLRAQSDLESAIDQYSALAARGYIQPLADVLVANLSMGYITGAGTARRLTFGIEAVSMAAAISDNLRVYTLNAPAGFQPSSVETPTVFGGTGPTLSHSSIPGQTYRLADGVVNTDYFPSAAPQLRVGGLFGTEVAVRWMNSKMVPFLDEEDFPELTLLGVGVQHSISQYLMLPIDISVTGSVNSLKFGDMVDLRSNSVGLNVGRWFGPIGLSGGILSESGTMNVTYTSTDPDAPGSVDMDLDVKRTMRVRTGAMLHLGFFRFFGDAAFGDITSYAAGFRFGF